MHEKEASCILEGGRIRDPALRNKKPQDIFLMTDEKGNPLPGSSTDKTMPFRMYYAKKPAFAATKAYYALVRIQKPSKVPMPKAHVEEIENHVQSLYPEHLNDYMRKVREATAEPSSFIHLRRPDENTVKTYFVGYERVLKPNKHEISKGIVKVAVAKRR